MTLRTDSPAVAIARAHAEAWTATSTQPMMAPTDTTGVDDYMAGLVKFAGSVVPGSARVLAAIGDERNSLILITVKAALGPGGTVITLPAARLALIDEQDKIKAEQVVFFAVPE